MNRYAKGNLFIRKDDMQAVEGGGQVKLEKAKVRVLRGKVTNDGWRSDPSSHERWLIVEDGTFWPVMVRLDDNELECR